MVHSTSFFASQVVAEVTTLVTGRVLATCQPGPETWLCRSWAVDSSFTVWAGGTSPPSALARPSGVITKGGPGGVLQLWVLRSHSPGIRENQRPPPLSVQLPLAVSVKLPNGS